MEKYEGQLRSGYCNSTMEMFPMVMFSDKRVDGSDFDKTYTALGKDGNLFTR